eukprot:136931-Pyramimonas_sp.AAC.1
MTRARGHTTQQILSERGAAQPLQTGPPPSARSYYSISCQPAQDGRDRGRRGIPRDAIRTESEPCGGGGAARR